MAIVAQSQNVLYRPGPRSYYPPHLLKIRHESIVLIKNARSEEMNIDGKSAREL